MHFIKESFSRSASSTLTPYADKLLPEYHKILLVIIDLPRYRPAPASHRRDIINPH